MWRREEVGASPPKRNMPTVIFEIVRPASCLMPWDGLIRAWLEGHHRSQRYWRGRVHGLLNFVVQAVRESGDRSARVDEHFIVERVDELCQGAQCRKDLPIPLRQEPISHEDIRNHHLPVPGLTAGSFRDRSCSTSKSRSGALATYAARSTDSTAV